MRTDTGGHSRGFKVLCCGLVLALCGGCAIRAAMRESEPPEGSYRIYYTVAEANSSGPAVDYQYYVPPEEGDLVRSLISKALDQPEGEALISPYPAGVSLRSAVVENGVLSLDLSEQYGALSGVRLTVANYCLVLTLSQVEGVEALRITVEGEELPYFSGKELRAEDAFLTSDEEKPVYVDAALWFGSLGYPGLWVEVRQVLKTEEETSSQALLKALIDGPEGEGLYTLLPEETQVRSAVVEDGVCTVDFTAAFLTGSGEDESRDRMLLYAVVNTLTGSLGSVEQVRILVEGAPLDNLGGIPLTNPIRPDFSLEGRPEQWTGENTTRSP